jgi:hypothetical protein
VPLMMVDIRLSSNTVIDQALPASYNGFLYAWAVWTRSVPYELKPKAA